MNSSTYYFTHQCSFIESLIHCFLVGFMDSVLRPFVDSLIHRLIGPLTHCFIDSFSQLSMGSFMSCHRHLSNNVLIVDASHNFNISLLLHFINIPVSRLLPIVIPVSQALLSGRRPIITQAWFKIAMLAYQGSHLTKVSISSLGVGQLGPTMVNNQA